VRVVELAEDVDLLGLEADVEGVGGDDLDVGEAGGAVGAGRGRAALEDLGDVAEREFPLRGGEAVYKVSLAVGEGGAVGVEGAVAQEAGVDGAVGIDLDGGGDVVARIDAAEGGRL